MTGTWMAYALAVSGVAMAAGLGVERALERLGRPTRWVWLCAMVAGVTVPAVALLRAPLPAAPLATGTASSVGEVMVVGAASLPETPPAPPLTLDAALLLGWGAASLVLALALAWSVASLARTRRAWRWAEVEGAGAWVSERTGPAVVGFLRPAIVLPEWVLEWDPAPRRLIVAHEREHLRAGDGRLLLAALLLLCAAPWNLALWWQWRRLRQAVETDCDRRVLAAEPDVRRYGTLLLEVAERTRRTALPMAAFAESRSSLERRLRVMTDRKARNRAAWMLAVAASVVGAPVALLALPAPTPVGVQGVRGAVTGWMGKAPRPTLEFAPAAVVTESPAMRAAVSPATFADERAAAVLPAPAPDTTPTPGMGVVPPARKPAAARDTVPARYAYEVAVLERKPELMNKSQVQSMLSRYYPRILEDARIGGTTEVQFEITPEGMVEPSSIKVLATSHEQFAEASTKVVERFVFRPGIYKGKPVRVLIQMPIAWQPRTNAAADTVVPRDFSRVGGPSGARQPKGFQELVPPKDAPPSTASASRITGRVVDRAGRPVTGASVVIQSLNRGTVTGSNGTFTLPVPAGTYALDVLAPGWSSGVNRSVSVTAGQAQSVEITAP